jgi:hypothetical protein
MNETNIGMLGNFKICFEERAKGKLNTLVNSDKELFNSKFISMAVDLINKYKDIVIVKSGVLFHSPSFEINSGFESYNEFYFSNQVIYKFDFEKDFGWVGILLVRELLNKIEVFDNIVEDLLACYMPGEMAWNPGNNPMTAVFEFLKSNDNFEIDKSIENKILISVAPDGYLKKVK